MKYHHYFLFLLLVVATVNVNAQCYTVAQVSYQPAPYVGVNSANVPNDDVYSAVIPIGFNFCFFDLTYSRLVISSNSYVTFDTSLALQYSPWPIQNAIPSPNNPTNVIMAPWEDINPALGGTVTYELQGAAPYRRFVVSWSDVPMYLCDSTYFTNQLILYETTNIIEMNIKEKPICDMWNGGAAIEGIQNTDGTQAYVVPGRNFPTQWDASYDSWRFIPTCGCAGPGASNLIAGKLFADYNSDCISNGSDEGLVNQLVLANSGEFYAYTDSNGDYTLMVDTGDYSITHVVLPLFINKCPASGNYDVQFTTMNNSVLGQDFADTSDVACTDLNVDIGVPNLSGCWQEYGGISYCNLGTISESNTSIIMTLDDSLQLLTSSVTPVPLGNNQYQFNIGSLGIGECGFIYFSMSVGCDIVGTLHCLQASISGTGPDCDPSNNTATDCHTVIASLDPNGMETASHLVINHGYVVIDTIQDSDDLTYLIHFQNTGNDTAYNITLRDTLTALLDPSSIIMGASSHAYTWVLQNNVLTIQFSDIRLPDSTTNVYTSVGFVKYNVKQQAGNNIGDVIANHAAIYFDYNPAIITNNALSVIQKFVTSASDPSLVSFVSANPNPFSNTTTITVQSSLDHLQLSVYDLAGRKLFSHLLVNNQVTFSREGLAGGVYFYSIEKMDQKLASGKLVVE